MAVLVTDPDLGTELIRQRQRCDGDHFDEVWEGLYVVPPIANDEHQEIQMSLGSAIKDALGWDSPAKVRAGVNVSDRDIDWMQNYRCPDVVVYLPGNPAINHGAHWQGGPDFLAEILSDGDQARDKLPFYASVGVREVLIIGRNPWSLELYAAAGSLVKLDLVAAVAPGESTILQSCVLPVSFQLLAGDPRPKIKMALTGDAAADPGHRRAAWAI